MSVKRLTLLRNVGVFDSVTAGAQLPFSKLALVYGENSRGKSTLAAIFRSVTSANPQFVVERQRLGSPDPAHVVLDIDGNSTVFQHGAWTGPAPAIMVFDDAFVAENVCSGIDIETEHRQNLHELILGARGVSLNSGLQKYVARIEEHNQALRSKEGAIPATARGVLSVDAFCALPNNANIDAEIATVERKLAAARAADAVRQHAVFARIALPGFDTGQINSLLSRTLAVLEADAAARVRAHLRSLGKGGEAWVSDGMSHIAGASAGQEHSVCPFCAHSLEESELIRHYQAYFSDAYEELKTAITQADQGINGTHGGEVPAVFERSVGVAVVGFEFWRAFTDVPSIDIDTAAIVSAWTAARESVVAALRSKAAAPLQAMTLPPETLSVLAAHEGNRASIESASARLQACNVRIAIVKEASAAANISALTADLSRLQATRARHREPVNSLCQGYLSERASKTATEALRTQARDALDNYRQNIFPTYESALNTYLQRFNAGFRLGAVSSINNRGGSSCTYNVVINNSEVSLTTDTGPSFRTTLSAGDRNTLALAFFFASVDQDHQRAQKIVVIDDPMTSLDEHRSLTTVQEMRELLRRVSQMIVLSHSKPFLCALWEGADKAKRSAILLRRDGDGSNLAPWDVRQDCITEHDRRHELVASYIQSANPATERRVAEALRPILETFMRVAYPAAFPPGCLLGPFIGHCQKRAGTANQVLSEVNLVELRALLDYGNRFHHDTNSAWETAAINDQELTNFCRRTLAFASRS